jgi:hypothetical protein
MWASVLYRSSRDDNLQLCQRGAFVNGIWGIHDSDWETGPVIGAGTGADFIG